MEHTHMDIWCTEITDVRAFIAVNSVKVDTPEPYIVRHSLEVGKKPVATIIGFRVVGVETRVEAQTDYGRSG